MAARDFPYSRGQRNQLERVFRRANAFELSGPPSILHPKPPNCPDGPSNQQPGPRGPLERVVRRIEYAAEHLRYLSWEKGRDWDFVDNVLIYAVAVHVLEVNFEVRSGPFFSGLAYDRVVEPVSTLNEVG